MVGAQKATYELAVTINEYFALSSTAVMASGCIDFNSVNFRSISVPPFDGDFLELLNTYTKPSVLPLKIYSESGVYEASIVMFNVFRRAGKKRISITN